MAEPFIIELIPQLSRERVQQLLAGIQIELPTSKIDAASLTKIRADIQTTLTKTPFAINVEASKASLNALRKQIEDATRGTSASPTPQRSAASVAATEAAKATSAAAREQERAAKTAAKETDRAAKLTERAAKTAASEATKAARETERAARVAATEATKAAAAATRAANEQERAAKRVADEARRQERAAAVAPKLTPGQLQQNRVSSLGDKVGKLAVELDLDPADRELRQFTEQFTKSAKNLRLEINDEAALTDLQQIEDQLRELPGLARKALDVAGPARPKLDPRFAKVDDANRRVRNLEIAASIDPSDESLKRLRTRLQTQVENLSLEFDTGPAQKELTALKARLGKFTLVPVIDPVAAAKAAQKLSDAEDRRLSAALRKRRQQAAKDAGPSVITASDDLANQIGRQGLIRRARGGTALGRENIGLLQEQRKEITRTIKLNVDDDQLVAKLTAADKRLQALERKAVNSLSGRRSFASSLDAIGIGRETVAARGLRGVGRVLGDFGLAGGAIAITTRLIGGAIANSRKLAEEVRDVANSSGLGAREASKFAFAFKAVQINTNQGAKALLQFAKNADNPALANLGINVQRTKAGTVDLGASLLSVADAFNAAQGSTAKTNVLFAAFGRQAETLVPLLEKGRIGIVELQAAAAKSGLLFSEADLRRARDFEKTISLTKATLSGVGQDIANQLIGPLDSLAQTLPGAISRIGGSLSAGGEILGQGVGNLQSFFGATGGKDAKEFRANLLLDISSKQVKDAVAAAEETLQSQNLDKLRLRIDLGEGAFARSLTQKIPLISDQGNRVKTILVDLQDNIDALVDQNDISTLTKWRDQLKFGGTAEQIKAVAAGIDKVTIATTKLTLTDLAADLKDSTKSVDELRQQFLNLDKSDNETRTDVVKQLTTAVNAQAEALVALPGATRDAASAIRQLTADEAALAKLLREDSGSDPSIRLEGVRERIAGIQAERQVVKDLNEVQKTGIDITKTQAEIAKTKGADTAKALKGVADAELALGRLREDRGRRDVTLAQAEQSRIKALDTVTDVTRELAAAERNRDRAQISRGDATQSLLRAQQDDGRTQQDVRKGLAELTNTQDAYRDSVLASVSAQQSLNSAIAANVAANENIGGITKSRGEFEQARAAAAQAFVAILQAQSDATKATQGSDATATEEERLRKRQDLQRQLEDSTKSLRDAGFALADSNVSLADSEIELARKRRDLAIDAGLGLKQAEFGIVDARRGIIDFASDVIGAETRISDARAAIVENSSKLVELEQRLAELRQKQAEAKPGDELNRLQAQEKALQRVIKAEADRDEAADRRNVKIPEAQAAVEAARANRVTSAATRDNVASVAAGGAASPTAETDAQLKALGLPSTAQIQLDNIVLKYQVGTNPVTYTSFADAVRAEAATVSEGITLKINVVPLVKQDSPDIPAGTAITSAGSIQLAAGRNAINTFTPQPQIPFKPGAEVLAQKKAAELQIEALQRDLARRVDLSGASKDRIDVEIARRKNVTDQIAELKKQIQRFNALLGPVGVLRRFAGGDVVQGRKYEVNELGMEHMRTRTGHTVPILGGRQYAQFKIPGVVVPANVTPAVPRSGNNSAPPQVIVQTPPAPKEPMINIENLHVDTAAKTARAVGIVSAMAVYAMKRG